MYFHIQYPTCVTLILWPLKYEKVLDLEREAKSFWRVLQHCTYDLKLPVLTSGRIQILYPSEYYRDQNARGATSKKGWTPQSFIRRGCKSLLSHHNLCAIFASKVLRAPSQKLNVLLCRWSRLFTLCIFHHPAQNSPCNPLPTWGRFLKMAESLASVTGDITREDSDFDETCAFRGLFC